MASCHWMGTDFQRPLFVSDKRRSARTSLRAPHSVRAFSSPKCTQTIYPIFDVNPKITCFPAMNREGGCFLSDGGASVVLMRGQKQSALGTRVGLPQMRNFSFGKTTIDAIYLKEISIR